VPEGGRRSDTETEESEALMRTRSLKGLGVGLALIPAIVAAVTVRGIYQEGNLLSSGLALLFPVLALLYIHEEPGKRVLSALTGLLAGCVVTLLWIGFGEEVTSFALLTVVLVALIVPIAIDLVLLDTGPRVPLSPQAARAAAIAFTVTFVPLAATLVSNEHYDVVRKDQALIREVARHIQVHKNSLVFDRIDPKRKTQLKNRVAVRAMGKTYQLSNAHFESVSEERTVKKKTEKRGGRKTLEVSREREEQMRVVVDLGNIGKPENIVLFSTRGPVTIAEQEVDLPGEDADDDPVS